MMDSFNHLKNNPAYSRSLKGGRVIKLVENDYEAEKQDADQL
jgi:hypothetical protein